MTTPPPPMAKRHSTNAQRQRSVSGGVRMRWRTTVADETWWMRSDILAMEKWRRHGNRQATGVGGRGTTMALTTMTTKQQSTNVRRQRRRTTTADKRRRMNESMAEDNGGCLDRTPAEDQLLHGGRGWTMVRRRRIYYGVAVGAEERLSCGSGGETASRSGHERWMWKMGGDVFILFLGGGQILSSSYLFESCPKLGVIVPIIGGYFGKDSK